MLENIPLSHGPDQSSGYAADVFCSCFASSAKNGLADQGYSKENEIERQGSSLEKAVLITKFIIYSLRKA